MCAVRCEGARQAAKSTAHTALRGAGNPRTGNSFIGLHSPTSLEDAPAETALLQLYSLQSYSLHTLCSSWVPALCLSHRGVHSLSPASYRSCKAELLMFQLFSYKLGAVGCILCTGVLRLNPSKLREVLKGGHGSPIYIF